MAGDGKLGGLVDPNDGLCHLNSSGFYDWSTVQGKKMNAQYIYLKCKCSVDRQIGECKYTGMISS